MIRFACIDLGSNSIRCGIYEKLNARTPSRTLYSEKAMVQLGADVFGNNAASKRIGDAKIRLLIAQLNAFVKAACYLKAQAIFAYATAAIRHAKNQQKVLKHIFEKTGIQFRVIDGETEAQLIEAAVLKYDATLSEKDNYIIIDIGGGSTECIVKSVGTHVYQSFEIGSQSNRHHYFKRFPPSQSEIYRFKADLNVILKDFSVPKGKPFKVIGTGGSMKAIVRFIHSPRYQHLKNPVSKIEASLADLEKVRLNQLLRDPYVDKKRAESIFGVLLLTNHILSQTQTQSLNYCPSSLKDGIVYHSTQNLTLKNMPETVLLNDANYKRTLIKKNTLGRLVPKRMRDKLIRILEKVFTFRLRDVDPDLELLKIVDTLATFPVIHVIKMLQDNQVHKLSSLLRLNDETQRYALLAVIAFDNEEFLQIFDQLNQNKRLALYVRLLRFYYCCLVFGKSALKNAWKIKKHENIIEFHISSRRYNYFDLRLSQYKRDLEEFFNFRIKLDSYKGKL